MDEDLHLPETLPVKNPNSSRNSSQIEPAQREGIQIKTSWLRGSFVQKAALEWSAMRMK